LDSVVGQEVRTDKDGAEWAGC